MAVYTLPNARGIQRSGLRTPETWEEWQDEYQRREERYNGEGYNDAEIREWHLFEARTDADEVIARTQQLTRDHQLVAEIGGSALAIGATLQDGPVNSPALTAEGQQIWRRSGLLNNLTDPAKMLVKLGRVGIEAALNQDGEPILLLHEPDQYRVSYGITNRSEITRVAITIPYWDEVQIGPTGEVLDSGTPHTYVRILTPEDVTTWIDGKIDDAQSGAHGLGVVPFVNCTFNRVGLTEHGHHAAHGLAPAIAHYDAAFMQMRAIGNRNGNPLLVGRGVTFGSTSDAASKLGRLLGLSDPASDLHYLEISAQGIKVLLEAANAARLAARETLPEFLFAGAGADASGEALRWRASAFERKYAGVRESWFRQLATITQIAQIYGAGGAYDPAEAYYEVVGAPLLPPDVSGEMEALEATTRIQRLTPADYVRRYQRLGLVPSSADPDTYAAESQDQGADTALRFFQGQQTPPPPGEEG